ncbi:PREDICTED: defensin-like protein 78 [Camelina sativa]|uniref:Defensin-like protein 78 n=1 Tax=Camelina sativa TaxID=90675 RepID=A0ABM1RBX3_CAMSA|nr:PREDICTED: defensin-like protein 78 [Camelina sativa]
MANKNTLMMISLVLILLISGSEARPEIYDRMCPGVCGSFVKPDCNGLCHQLGFPAGGYCKPNNTCCCKKKTSAPVDDDV